MGHEFNMRIYINTKVLARFACLRKAMPSTYLRYLFTKHFCSRQHFQVTLSIPNMWTFSKHASLCKILKCMSTYLRYGDTWVTIHVSLIQYFQVSPVSQILGYVLNDSPYHYATFFILSPLSMIWGHLFYKHRFTLLYIIQNSDMYQTCPYIPLQYSTLFDLLYHMATC